MTPHIQVDTYAERFTAANAGPIAAGYDLMVDGTDNFPSREVINTLCVQTGKSYVYGAIYLYDALDMSFQMVQFPKNPGCVVCAKVIK